MVSKEQLNKSTTAWYHQCKTTLWYNILFNSEWLGWDINLLEHTRESGKPYRKYVNERLLAAADAMKAIPGEMIAFTQLLHTASSVVLLESKRERLDATLELIKKQSAFYGIDPTTILTSVTLYFLIHDAENNYSNNQNELKAIKHLHNRLDQVKWLISEEALKALNMPYDK